MCPCQKNTFGGCETCYKLFYQQRRDVKQLKCSTKGPVFFLILDFQKVKCISSFSMYIDKEMPCGDDY